MLACEAIEETNELRELTTPTPTAEERILSTPGDVPEHLVWGDWHFWHPVDSLEIAVDIHNDVQFAGTHDFYFMVAHGRVGDTSYYFGFQTDIQHPVTFRGTGKGLIFSRWDTRDLADTRVAPGGFAQSAGHEGDFVGVRLNYEWRDGKYQLRMSPQESDGGGLWYGLWVQHENEEEATWIGSLRFPEGKIGYSSYTTVEVYGGGRLRPKHIPYWKVSIEPPRSGAFEAYLYDSGYNYFTGDHFPNVKKYQEGETLYLEVGLDTVNAAVAEDG